jgi:pantoate--beta-alanine ligase
MALQAVSSIDELRQVVATARHRGLTVGFVPTMGALHAGHVSLIQAARQETGFVVVSIFVNPTQFAPHEDFQRYPRPLEQDLAICAQTGVDLAFLPGAEEVYPNSFCTWVDVTGPLAGSLEGASRPGHFRGVATVVLKLLNMVGPDIAYFGQKDAQQARLVQQLVRDLNVPVTIRVCPTVREADGLALSSRNVYLTPEQRRLAVVLYQSLLKAQEMVAGGERDAARIQAAMTAFIQAAPGAVIDYVALVDNETLRPLDRIEGTVLALVAVRFGATRLIDNVVLNAPEPRTE